MRLCEYLEGYAKKRLVAVDLPRGKSHQHELNGVGELRQMLGGSRLEGRILWSYMHDLEGDITSEDGTFTFYDAREKHASRTEWRFYYGDVAPMDAAKVGDLMVLARAKGRPPAELFGFIFPAGSSWERKAEYLFGGFTGRLHVPGEKALSESEVRLAESVILELMGLGREFSESEVTHLVDKHFPGDKFPPTRDLATMARESVQLPARSDADTMLTTWLEQETKLFYALERRIVGKRLKTRFDTVEEFISYSLSVQNRRKSRMGASLEHHLDALFRQCGLRFDHPGHSEMGNEPDFLFPGDAAYADLGVDAAKLLMLAAKATCKDRWRQVLVEADRIRIKHVCTLEPGISPQQTAQMARAKIILVVPSSLHHTFDRAQLETVLRVADFIRQVRGLQDAGV